MITLTKIIKDWYDNIPSEDKYGPTKSKDYCVTITHGLYGIYYNEFTQISDLYNINFFHVTKHYDSIPNEEYFNACYKDDNAWLLPTSVKEKHLSSFKELFNLNLIKERLYKAKEELNNLRKEYSNKAKELLSKYDLQIDKYKKITVLIE